MRWLRRIATELDLTVSDESEVRGFVKGLAVGLVVYLGLLIGTTWAYIRTTGG